ncbi:dermonecrotic toxin domain-containing protein [Pseudomonas mohnii]
MPVSPAPLFFPEALQSPGLWNDLGKIHGLSRKDFEWLGHVELASQALRSQQTPPMLAHKVLVNATGFDYTPLAGSFVLSLTPDDNGLILYTPYDGIKKFDRLVSLKSQLEQRLDSATEDDRLLALMSLAQRKALAASDKIQVTFQVIEGDVFEDQRAAIAHQQRLNDQAMLDELLMLPTLASLLDTMLDEWLQSAFPGLDQSRTRVNFYTLPAPENHGQEPVRRWRSSLSLSDAVLLYYRHQRWPSGDLHEFAHPDRTSTSTDQQHWETAVEAASRKLNHLLCGLLQRYWGAVALDGGSRRRFFSRAIGEQARAELLLKREAGIISPEQFQALHGMIEQTATTATTIRRPTLETVHLWEYQGHYVELAGSLMISHAKAYLYTPTQGLQVLKDYPDLKATLLSKFSAAGHEDELYGLLTLEERNRFLGFDKPHVSGEVISGSIFNTLFEAIIGKQLQNMEYALQVFRYSDGNMDIHALFDKALDIRSMLSERLLTLDTHGRWSTRPVLAGKQQPSIVRADTATQHIKTFTDVEALIRADFTAQPLASLALQRLYLEDMKPRLAHALSVGIRGEASLRVLQATLRDLEQAIVDTVLNPDQPDRKNRRALNGFRPDAYSLVLECSGQQDVLPLSNCLVLTERGGLDNQHSGRAILWTPAAGLEVFDSVDSVKQALNLRLLDPRKRLALLENLTTAQRKTHGRYSLNSLRLIEGNVLQHLSQTAIDHFLSACEHLRTQDLGDEKKHKALKSLANTVIDTNLRRAALIAQSISRQQTLPGWLGMAPVQEQQLHMELLEQYRHSVTDDKDYLHGIQTLSSYVHARLKALLASRFPETTLDPDEIEITPSLALAGPSRTLTEFALNHINVDQGSGFKIASATGQTLPARLDRTAIQQLLQSLEIQRDYATLVNDALTGADAESRKLRFVRQLPWQLLQHAHALKLQQHLSAAAFDLIGQVVDMPDAIARAAVQGAHAVVRPLELIKTPGAAAVKALGLYLIGPGAGKFGPQVLLAPYHPTAVFSEFENEASAVAALTEPGPLQDLLIRRLPENQRTVFANLFKSSVGQPSEITLASSPLTGNFLSQMFSDNVNLLSQMFGSQSDTRGQSDWEALKNLFSAGINRVIGLLPGKLACISFLWQSFKDFEASAEALQDHHWQRALQAFIAGALQMVSLGRLSLETSAIADQATAEDEPVIAPVNDPQWARIRPTATSRTALQPFEAPTVALKDLTKHQTDGTYSDPVSKKSYAAIAGKVYPVNKPGAVWQLLRDNESGPSLRQSPTRQMVVDPDLHTVHYGKALSKMHNQYAIGHEVRQVLNIEARGMEDIRTHHPEKARMIAQAIDMARYYAFNSLHNLAQLRQLLPGTRLDAFLKHFFDVHSVDNSLLDKIKQTIVPVCTALVDPDEDLLNSERFIVGSNKYQHANLIAFVVQQDARKNVHFTERFFDQQLDWYKFCLTEPFNVDGHSQAATLIHEFAHLFSKAVDIASLEARRPFSDLVTPITQYGHAMKQSQVDFQRAALSLGTPREELFARWSDNEQAWIDLDDIPGLNHVGKAILNIVGTRTMEGAREAFLDRHSPDKRIDIILRNADSIAFLICEMGRQLDPLPGTSASQA